MVQNCKRRWIAGVERLAVARQLLTPRGSTDTDAGYASFPAEVSNLRNASARMRMRSHALRSGFRNRRSWRFGGYFGYAVIAIALMQMRHAGGAMRRNQSTLVLNPDYLGNEDI